MKYLIHTYEDKTLRSDSGPVQTCHCGMKCLGEQTDTQTLLNMLPLMLILVWKEKNHRKHLMHTYVDKTLRSNSGPVQTFVQDLSCPLWDEIPG